MYNAMPRKRGAKEYDRESGDILIRIQCGKISVRNNINLDFARIF